MNVAAYEAITNIEDVNYVGPVNPPPILTQKIISKFWRILGRQGDFFFFSQQRLRITAAEVHQRSDSGARLDFFHGFTPWVLTEPKRPYVAWSDCTFRDYIDVYHDRQLFRPKDLDRIERAEADWLGAAEWIGFSSRWAAKRAVKYYGLNESNVRFFGIFGEMDPPEEDEFAGTKQFVFVSTNFRAKGGPAVLAAFRLLRQRHPDASLVIVGAPPHGDAMEGVHYAGWLRKEKAGDYRQFRQIMTRSRALVHPTNTDLAPLIIVEAAYCGCPAISSRMFAIPELIDDRSTGLLIDNPANVAEVETAMAWMLENEDAYRQMRHAARDKARKLHSRGAFAERLCQAVRKADTPATAA